MKTRLLIIGLIISSIIAFSIFFVFYIFDNDNSAYKVIDVKMNVIGIKQFYEIGEPVSFSVHVDSLGKIVPWPTLRIYQNYVDISSEPVYSKMYMTPTELEDKQNSLEWRTKTWNFPLESDDSIRFFDKGNYTLRVDVDAKKHVLIDFRVVNSTDEFEIINDFAKNQSKHPDTPEIFSHGSTKFVNPNHESLKYYKTTQVIDDTYLGKNVQQWQDAWDWELEANYEIYKDEFYEELGRLLVKNEITQVMNQVGIINAHDDFKVHQGYSLTSLPPHVGFTTVINATDGNSYLIESSAHSNRVNYYAITQLTFFDTTEELSLVDILSYPQTIHVLPEDGHKSKAEPGDLIIHVDNNTVNFVNRTPETIRIQESGTGEIAREHELTWIGPTILPFGNDQVIFEKPGIYEWDARKAPTLENPLWWDSHASGEIVVLADNMDDLPLEDRLHMGRTILMNSEIPTSGMGIGNAEHALKVGLRSAIYEMLPNAVQYYQDRAEQLIPFDIPIIIEG